MFSVDYSFSLPGCLRSMEISNDYCVPTLSSSDNAPYRSLSCYSILLFLQRLVLCLGFICIIGILTSLPKIVSGGFSQMNVFELGVVREVNKNTWITSSIVPSL